MEINVHPTLTFLMKIVLRIHVPGIVLLINDSVLHYRVATCKSDIWGPKYGIYQSRDKLTTTFAGLMPLLLFWLVKSNYRITLSHGRVQ